MMRLFGALNSDGVVALDGSIGVGKCRLTTLLAEGGYSNELVGKDGRWEE
jgi:deoxyadenosine/deoxycytidine kinase